MKIKKVITINNVELPITECQKFTNGNYYKIGDVKILNSGDCYRINNRFYRIDTGLVVFDYEIEEYVLLSDFLKRGIVEFDEKTKKFIIGYFSPSSKNVTVNLIEQFDIKYCISSKIINKNKKYREHISSGVYHSIYSLPALEFITIKKPSQEYKTSLNYDSINCMNDFVHNYNNSNVEISNNVKSYAPLLNDLSFGFEFETTKGILPDHILNETCLIPLRDGSISGLEYVTVPLSGEKGLQSLINSVEILKKRTTYNETCALHLHIGNIPRTKEFILAFLKVTCKLQDEIYELFPLYKKYNFGVKSKNYSKPYNVYSLISKMDRVINSDNIDNNFDVLYQHLSGNNSHCYNLEDVHYHPNDPDGNAKWHINSRYYIHNLIPLIFGNKKTIEFRIHTPTFDVNKIILFLFMNALIINFTKLHCNTILKNPTFVNRYSLLDIVSNIQNNTNSEYLKLIKDISQYISLRKEYTYYDNAAGNIRGNEENIKISPRIKWDIQTYSKNSEFSQNDIFNKFISAIETENRVLDFSNLRIS